MIKTSYKIRAAERIENQVMRVEMAAMLDMIRENKDRITPMMEPGQKRALLEEHHPDSLKAGRSKLAFGPNLGDLLPEEFIRLVESKVSYPGDLKTEQTDLLIIGSGAAGLSAALEASGSGIRVMVITAETAGSSNTVLAQGGMSAAVGPDDSPALHTEDTLQGGQTNNPRLAEILAEEGPQVVSWLEKLGMLFDRGIDNSYRLLGGAGHSRKRVLTHKGFIGPRLMKVLLKAFKQTDAELRVYHRLSELWCENERCRGAYVLNETSKEHLKVEAKAVILATGGMGGLKPLGLPTSNHHSIKGEGLAAGYRAGIRLIDMDSSQFHPTGAIWPNEVAGLLVSEGVRSLGAGLYNRQGRQFINQMETRDVVTAAMIREMSAGQGIDLPGGGSGLLLNISDLPEETLQKSLGRIYKKLVTAGYNLRETPLLVVPVYHYQNGGLEINENGRTSLAGLWAAGEVAGGVHGKNRLGGNALTDAFVFGRRAGRDALKSITGPRIF